MLYKNEFQPSYLLKEIYFREEKISVAVIVRDYILHPLTSPAAQTTFYLMFLHTMTSTSACKLACLAT